MTQIFYHLWSNHNDSIILSYFIWLQSKHNWSLSISSLDLCFNYEPFIPIENMWWYLSYVNEFTTHPYVFKIHQHKSPKSHSVTHIILKTLSWHHTRSNILQIQNFITWKFSLCSWLNKYQILWSYIIT